MNDLWRRIQFLFQRRRLDRELDEELRAHLALEAQERIEAGVAPEEAWARARRDFGNLPLVKEVTRETWGWMPLDRLGQDLRYAVRTMRRSPGFTLVAVLSLALGIGANTAVFGALDAVLWKMLPVEHPEQLIELLTVRGGAPFNAFSFQALDHFRAHNHVLAGLIASSRSRFYTIVEGGSPERLDGQYVTGNYFDVLGVRTIVGRPLAAEDDRFGAGNAVAVISHRYWQSRFGGDGAAVGGSVVLEDLPFTIVGVAPPEFFGVQVGARTDIWIPLAMEPRIRKTSYTRSAGYKWLQLVGRLEPGVSMEQATAELGVLFKGAVIEEEAALQREAAAREQARSWTLRVEPAANGLSQLRRQFSHPLWVLMLVVGIVLVIACANVANLLLARAEAREKEMAVRLSLGAGRLRLFRQLLTESLVLSGLGGVLGLAFSYWASRYLAAVLSSGRTAVTLVMEPDGRLLAFTAALALLTGVLFGLIPAFRAADTDLVSSLKGGVLSSDARPRRHVASKLLVSAQVALLLVLVLGAGLFLRSLHNLRSIDLGFDHGNVLLIVLDPSHSGYAPERLRRLYADLLERFEAIPGIESASLSWITPITGGGSNRTVWIDGAASGRRSAPDTYLNWVAPKYFTTLGTPIVAGRDFDARDSATTPRVVIVNRTFARRLFGSENPVGKRVLLDEKGDTGEIVGVVGDAKYLELREATPATLYLNTFQAVSPASQFVVRTAVNPASLAGKLRREIQTAAGNIAVVEVKTLGQQVDASIVQERLLAMLAALFGSIALVMAALGLYGVISYSVVRRTREIGIRIAVGAAPSTVVGMVLRETLLLVAAGLAAGLPVALALGRFTSSLLYGLTPTDPLILSISVVTLLVVALAAGFLPARRAAGVDPMAALRCD